jgi:hypothetical protein
MKHRAKNMDVSWIGMLRESQRDTDYLGDNRIIGPSRVAGSQLMSTAVHMEPK